MSDVRRLLKKQKTERSKTNRITHPFAKYDDTARLTCIVCNSIVKSESVWQAHLGSTLHRENIAKLKVLKEQRQAKRPAPSITEQPEAKRAKQQQQSLTVEYSDDDSEEEEEEVKEVEKEEEDGEEEEEEEEEDNALPADFFDNQNEQADDDMEEVVEEEQQQQEDSNTLPAGFFDDPEEDARVHGSIAPAEQAELDLEQDMEEFKDAMVDVTKEAEKIQEDDDELFWQERNEDLYREQAELDSRVEKLKKLRQSGAPVEVVKEEVKKPIMTEDDDGIRDGLKQSVRQVLKTTLVKKTTTMFDDMDEDSSEEEEEEEEEEDDDDDWRAQQL